MRHIRPNIFRRFALFGVVSLLAAPGCSCERSERKAGEVVVLIDSAPESLDRRFALSAVAQRVTTLITPGLVRIDDDGSLVPDLAESFERVDETRYRFVLREGLTFHDGTPVTSRDVVYTYKSLKLRGSPLSPRYDPIAKIEPVGERTVDLVLAEPFAPLLIDLTMGIVPRHLGDKEEYEDRPIGAGPFKFASRPSEERIVLEPFDGWYGGKPDVDRLVFAVVRDETTRVLSLLHGDADLATGSISPILIPRIEEAEHLTVQRRPGSGYAYMAFNLRHPILSNVEVRRALAHAIDRETIARYKFRGAARPATGMLPEGHWAHSPARRWHYDPAVSEKLLDEAGFPRKGDGGERFRITYSTSTDRFRKSVALVVASQLEAVGIGVNLRAYEWGTFYGDVRRGRFDVTTLMWTPVVEPHLLHWVFHSDSIPSEENDWVGGNRGAFRNSKVDRLLDEAAENLCPDQRAGRYARVQEILAEELPYVSMWHEETVAVVGERLEGFSASPFGFLDPLAHASVRPAPGSEADE